MRLRKGEYKMKIIIHAKDVPDYDNVSDVKHYMADYEKFWGTLERIASAKKMALGDVYEMVANHIVYTDTDYECEVE
jgi:hypothetical protein